MERIYMNGMVAGEARNPNLVRRSSQARGFWHKRAAEVRRETNDRRLVPTNGPLFKRKKAGAGRSVAHLTHNVLATVPSLTRHIDARS
jgi:hypothetical protein